MAEMTRDIDEAKEDRKADRIEWVIGAISSLVVIALIAFLVYQGGSGAGSQAELRIEVERTAGFEETGHIRFAVFNTGGSAASHVVVTAAELAADGTVAVEHTLALDYVPANSSRAGGLFVDPQAEVVFRIDGYVDP